MLQQFTEGHNLTTQDLLREQPTHSGDINLIGMLCDMLLVQCYNTSLVKIMQREQVGRGDCTTNVGTRSLKFYKYHY